MHYSKCVLVLVLALFGRNNADDPIVQLPKGKIRGHILKSEQGKPYYAFQEIPYAAPPTGSNRFQLPKDVQAWPGIRDTTKNTVMCYQQKVDKNDLKVSEDCLYINVYSPVAPGSSKLLPVMVWIHGGRFLRHAGTFQYVGPQFVIDQEVVVVSFNYRMGPFGFLSTDDDVMPANLGLKDQHKALEWVNENIHLFGGDNSKVTIAGESSGGMSVNMHLLGPWKNNKVLFHGAILSSGSLMFMSRTNRARENAFKVGKNIDRSFSSENSRDLLRVLQKPSSAEILEAAKEITFWMPILEKNGPFEYQTWEAIAKGNIKKVPIIIGFNSEEMIAQATNPSTKQAAAALDKSPFRILPMNFKISNVNRTVAGNLMKKVYTSTTFADNMGAYIRYLSDSSATNSAIKLAGLYSKYADVYLYQFGYKGELGGKMNFPHIAGCGTVGHAEDLQYLWDDEVNSDLTKFPTEDRLMLHRFVKLWTNFVKYHNPTPQRDTLLGNVQWTKLNPSKLDSIPYLNMNGTLAVGTNPRNFQQVNKILDKYVTYNDIL